MDLYLVSPVFLKRLMTQRPSGTTLLKDGRTIDAALPFLPFRVHISLLPRHFNTPDEGSAQETHQLAWQPPSHLGTRAADWQVFTAMSAVNGVQQSAVSL
ncbi:hypothetical protein O3P69_001536 [Scylla paramamosain]|uniref:Uncharacterized protein n=1 Tax=Scylla paramamosain TaxID=85552 RepID=A0AAW0V144_SCYPA